MIPRATIASLTADALVIGGGLLAAAGLALVFVAEKIDRRVDRMIARWPGEE